MATGRGAVRAGRGGVSRTSAAGKARRDEGVISLRSGNRNRPANSRRAARARARNVRRGSTRCAATGPSVRFRQAAASRGSVRAEVPARAAVSNRGVRVRHGCHNASHRTQINRDMLGRRAWHVPACFSKAIRQFLFPIAIKGLTCFVRAPHNRRKSWAREFFMLFLPWRCVRFSRFGGCE